MGTAVGSNDVAGPTSHTFWVRVVSSVLPFTDSLAAPVIMACIVPPFFTVLFLGFPNWLTCFLLGTRAEASSGLWWVCLGLLATMARETNLFQGSELRLHCCLASFSGHQPPQGGWSHILKMLQAHVHGQFSPKIPR